jgi:multidrug efflux pump subunit AcrB
VLSVFNAVTLTPALAALLLDKEVHTHGRFFTGFNRVVEAGTNGYVRLVRGALRLRYVMLLLFVGGCSRPIRSSTWSRLRSFRRKTKAT